MGQSKANIDGVATIPGVVAGLEFTTVTGGEVTAEVIKDRSPGGRFPTATATLPEITNIVATVWYDHGTHGPIMGKLIAACGPQTDCTFGKIIRDGNQNRLGVTVHVCQLVAVRGPDGDTNDAGAKAMLECEFAVSSKA